MKEINIWRWIFEWEKNGKGKEYNWNVISIYGDEYLNEAKNHYNEKADLVFEGEYLNGKRWNGKGNMMSMDYLWLKVNIWMENFWFRNKTKNHNSFSNLIFKKSN